MKKGIIFLVVFSVLLGNFSVFTSAGNINMGETDINIPTISPGIEEAYEDEPVTPYPENAEIELPEEVQNNTQPLNYYLDTDYSITDGDESFGRWEGEDYELYPDTLSDVQLATLSNEYALQKSIEMSEFSLMMTRQYVLGDKNSDILTSILQGGCTDGTYYYFSFILYEHGNDKTPYDTLFVCARKRADNSFEVLHRSFGLINVLLHSGDMTYNPITDEIIITTSKTPYHNIVQKLPASKARQGVVNKDNFTQVQLPVRATSINYCEKRNQYVVGITKRNNYYAVLDSNFNLISCINTNVQQETYDSTLNWQRQGLYCDENYIYSLFYTNHTDSILGKQNKLRIYKWDGSIVKTIYLNVEQCDTDVLEAENIFMIDGKIHISFLLNGRANREYHVLDLSEHCFTADYWPTYYPGGIPDPVTGEIDDSDITDQACHSNFVIRGVPTKLHLNRTANSGNEFGGWHAYRPDNQKWLYADEDSGELAWLTYGSAQTEGYELYLYSEQQSVSQTAPAGEKVIFSPVFRATDKFYVTFKDSHVSNTYQQTITHGTSTALNSNVFPKPDSDKSVFKGWHAFWRERNLWLYEKTDGSLVWCIENQQPIGAKKYMYSNGESVARTVWKGSHVEMHAVWNEFFIYYKTYGNDSDNCCKHALNITQSKFKPMQPAFYISGNTNQIQAFKPSDIHVDMATLWGIDIAESDKENPARIAQIFDNNYTFLGYTLYRREVNKWYYYKDKNNKGWYYKGMQPDGYSLYLKTNADVMYLGGTALPGEHLELYPEFVHTGCGLNTTNT